MKFFVIILILSFGCFSSGQCDLHFIRKITNPANNESLTFSKDASFFQTYSSYVEELNGLIKKGDLRNNFDLDIEQANKVNVLLKKLVSSDPTKSLTMAELKALKNNESLKRVLYYIEKINHVSVQIPNKIRNIIAKHLTTRSSFGAFLGRDVDMFTKMKHIALDKLIFLANIFNPLPIDEIKRIYPSFFKRNNNEESLSSIRSIFKRQYDNPNITLLDEEIVLLKDKELHRVFKERGEFLQSKSTYFKVKKFGELNLSILGALSGMALINYAHDLSSSQIELGDYLEKGSLSDNEIQIIVDEEPFPHLALRVGDYIYSYGMTQMTKTHFKKYLRSSNMQDWMVLRGYDKKSNENVSTSIKSKLPASAHSAIISTLRIDQIERLRLLDYLESNVNKTYKNLTGINDCATMVVNALKDTTSIKIPFLIDSSPNQINIWLSTIMNFEKSYVLSIEHLLTQSAERKKYHFYRTLYLSIIESNAFIKFMPALKAYQGYFNLRYDKNEIQWFDEYELDYQEKIKKEIISKYKNMPTYIAVKKILKSSENKSCKEIDFLNLSIIMKTFESYIKKLDEEIEPFSQKLKSITFSEKFEAQVADEVIQEKKNEILEVYENLIDRCR